MTSKEGDKNMGLTLEGFIRFIKDFAKQDVRSVFIGLRSCGFDMFMERVFPAEFNSLEDMSWTKIQDEALVKHGNMLAQKFNCSPLKISSMMWVFISKWSKHQHLHWIGYCSNISNMIIAFLNLKHTSCYDHLLSSECVSAVVL